MNRPHYLRTSLILAILGAGLLWPVFCRAEDNLRYLTRPVLPTMSMYPLLKGGEILRVEVVPYAQLKKGDVILFWWPQYCLLVCHRLVGHWPDGSWMTEGDNRRCRVDAVAITSSNYRGKVIEIIP